MPVARLVVAEVGFLADQQVPGYLSQPPQGGHASLPQNLREPGAPPLPSAPPLSHAQCGPAALFEAHPQVGVELAVPADLGFFRIQVETH